MANLALNLGFEGIPAVGGPMTRNMEDLVFSMKVNYVMPDLI
jgi:hypothetical protein